MLLLDATICRLTVLVFVQSGKWFLQNFVPFLHFSNVNRKFFTQDYSFSMPIPSV